MTCNNPPNGFFALIASLLRRESKQAKKKTDTQAQSIKFKQGKIKCCKEKKITAPPNAWRNIPLCISLTNPYFFKVVILFNL